MQVARRRCGEGAWLCEYEAVCSSNWCAGSVPGGGEGSGGAGSCSKCTHNLHHQAVGPATKSTVALQCISS